MKVSICKNKLEIILEEDDYGLSCRQLFTSIMRQVSEWLHWRAK